MSLLNKIQKANQVERRLKAIFWGPSGVGKSTNALSIEGPRLVIDTEKGTEQFGEFYDFEVFSSRDFKDICGVIQELVKCGCVVNGTKFNTIIVDSFTEVHKLLEDYWLNQYRLKTGNPLYKFEPTDYKVLNQEFKDFVDDLLKLDANVICVAHAKDNYKPGTFMELDQLNPEIPDLPKKATHYFDVSLRFEKKGDKYNVYNVKSRIISPKTGRDALPARWQNIDNLTFVEELMKFAKGAKIAPERKSTEPKNVALAESVGDVNEVRAQIYTKVAELKLSKTKAQQLLLAQVGKNSTQELEYSEAVKFLEHLGTLTVEG